MQSSVTFSGPIGLIQLITTAAADIYEEYETDDQTEISISRTDTPLPAGQSVQFNPQQFAQTNANPGVAPATTPTKKARETAAEKRDRLAKEALAAAPAVEPNAAAVAQIQQQSQWAQQPAQPGVQYPQQPGGFPGSPVNPAQPAGFPAQAPAQPVVDTAAQAWLAPQAVNAPAGPTLEQVYQILNTPVFIQDNTKRALFQNWMYFKQIPNQDLTHMKDQPALLAEAYGVVQKIISGEISQPLV